jgi:FAD/FMN-containing dehydrogenase
VSPSARATLPIARAVSDEPADRLGAVFGPTKYQRLVALKRRYDPDNVFRHNQNIAP